MKSINNWTEGEYNYKDKEGISWDSPDEWVVVGLCGLCGCGDDEIKEDIIKVLLAHKLRNQKDWFKFKQPIKNKKYYELILHILTKANLLEHGGSVGGSWLTDEGEEAIKKIEKEKAK